jgi:ribosomal-protein-alanine N-acetyltransferase
VPDQPELAGPDVRLVPVPPAAVETVLSGELAGRTAAPGWPTDDTPIGLAFTRTGGSTWLIVDATDRVAGELGTKAPPDAAGTVEIGYGLAAGSRGHGLGTAAVRLLVRWLVEQPEVRVVTATTDADNAASRRLLERIGFRRTSEDGDEQVEYVFAGTSVDGT